MAGDVEHFYSGLQEPARSFVQELRELILAHDPFITEGLKYGMPFFLYRKKMFCYFWTRKGSGQPYFGVVEGNRLFHPELIQEGRARMKILLLDPARKFPVQAISNFLQQAIALYSSGQSPIK